MFYKQRVGLYFWIVRLLKIPEGSLIPSYIRWIRYVLLPIETLSWRLSTATYDPYSDCFIINGIKISYQFMVHMTETSSKGVWFRYERKGNTIIRHRRYIDEMLP